MDRPDTTMMLVVHDAFRRDLARMKFAAAQIGNADIRSALRSGWQTFSRYLTVHHTAEDEVLWPSMQAKLGDHTTARNLLHEMTDEHARLDPVLREVDDNLAQGSADNLEALFDRLAAVLTDHLEHEESTVLPLVQEILTAEEWQAFGDDQRRRIGFDEAGWFFPWLLDDASAEVHAKVLGLVPRPLRLLHRALWEPRYRMRSPWNRHPAARH
ncbi:hemerythrin domain-containing protein [Mycolicibacterium houstonense]|uniref:hemerythrin domain-containing protein n=2 Tax=Mycolicibacterium houstonense TaxID=146021 RepID=UPI00082FD431|nr:hemerythrin domain-containing protein [Mycolicibacterium houstonense]